MNVQYTYAYMYMIVYSVHDVRFHTLEYHFCKAGINAGEMLGNTCHGMCVTYIASGGESRQFNTCTCSTGVIANVDIFR